jgi:hypothetical protein
LARQLTVGPSMVKPRLAVYLVRGAHAQMGKNLDMEIAEILWWFRFFDFVHLQVVVR